MQTPYVMVTYVSLGAILTFLGVYEPIVKFGASGATVPIIGFGYSLAFGASGATVPIIGFGYSLAKGVMKGIETDGFLGIFTGGVIATAGGVAAAIFFGYIISVIFNPKTKP